MGEFFIIIFLFFKKKKKKKKKPGKTKKICVVQVLCRLVDNGEKDTGGDNHPECRIQNVFVSGQQQLEYDNKRNANK